MILGSKGIMVEKRSGDLSNRGCLKLANVVQDQVNSKNFILNERTLWEEVREN